jgi:methylglutamate dehydrogenase subunit D
VPEFVLTQRSGLEQALVPGRYGTTGAAPGVTIALRDDLVLAMVMARAGKTAELAQRTSAVFGVALPLTPRRVENGPVSFAWAGPGRWLAATRLAATKNEAAGAFERRLRDELSGLASVSGQTDGRAIIRLSGAKLRAALAKGVPIDLDPRVFRPGDTALTSVAHINVQLWQVDDAPTYEFAVFRSFAAAFCEWLLAASAEFGTGVQPP